jgi:hypothetical protein
MVTEQLKKDRTVIRTFLNQSNKRKPLPWGELYTNDYKNSCSLKIQLASRCGVGYKDVMEFCSNNGIEGFEECPDSFGIYKKYKK